MANNFCTNCGSPLKAGAKFCGKCGTPSSGASPANNGNPENSGSPANTLSYRFMTPATYKKNLVVMKGCTLIFTDTRILVAFVDNNLMKQHMEQIRKEHEGEGFFKKAAASMSAGSSFVERYHTMSESEILSEAPNNFYIQNNNVERIRFKRSHTTYDSDNTAREYAPELKIKCPGEKYTFTFPNGLAQKAFINMLMALFPGSYKGPKR